MSVRTVLFDLDGTLLDTAPDFAHVLNGMRTERGGTAMDYAPFRATVSHGATAMLDMAFPGSRADELEALRKEFLDRYSDNLYRETQLFPGMERVLDELEALQVQWGIVTNKPGWLTAPLLDLAGLSGRVRCVVSGDTLPERKPHPAPVLHACVLAECSVAEAVYIGDAERDIQSGKAGGLRTGVALFGYIHPDDRPDQWGADTLLRQPEDILEWLGPSLEALRA